MISIKGQLTQEYILQQLSEEELFQRYLGVFPSLGQSYINPLPDRPRPDRRPGCRFYERADGRLIFKDYAWKGYDCFDVARAYYPQLHQEHFDEILYQLPYLLHH